MAIESSRVVNFLISLGDDAIMDQYKKNPRKVMKEAGLSEDQIVAIKKGDVKEMRSMLAKEVGAHELSAVNIMICIVDSTGTSS